MCFLGLLIIPRDRLNGPKIVHPTASLTLELLSAAINLLGFDWLQIPT